MRESPCTIRLSSNHRLRNLKSSGSWSRTLPSRSPRIGFLRQNEFARSPSETRMSCPDTPAEVLAALVDGNEQISESVARGKELFASEKASCSKCHGKEGHGDGETNDYDEWAKDWTKRFGLDPTDEYGQVPLIARGALPVRKAIPRNFQEGIYRGGQQPEQIYQRIALGIEGTPMPAAAVSEQEIWDLVNFVRSLYVPNEEEGEDIEAVMKESSEDSVAFAR